MSNKKVDRKSLTKGAIGYISYIQKQAATKQLNKKGET
jgi:hypothetical protein